MTKCAICFCEFIPKRKTQKYCPDCVKEASKITKRKWYAKTNPNAYMPKEKKHCSVCGGPFKCHFEGIPYCNKHYLKMKFYGTTEKISRNKNKVIYKDTYCEILTSKNESILVDINDLDIVKNHSWCLSKTGYAVANINKKTIKLHRYILGIKNLKLVVDHINSNKLDNRRSNLRICTQKENGKNIKKKKNNTLGYPGIRKTKSGKYVSRITLGGKMFHIGTFPTLEEAISKRKEAEIKYYKEYAPCLGATKQI